MCKSVIKEHSPSFSTIRVWDCTLSFPTLSKKQFEMTLFHVVELVQTRTVTFLYCTVNVFES